jgi:hypothetical protein
MASIKNTNNNKKILFGKKKRRTQTTNVGEDAGTKEPSHTAGRNVS